MKTILLITGLVYGLVCPAQSTYNLKFNPVNVDFMGKSLRFDLQKLTKKHVYYIGVGYLINPPFNGIFYNGVFKNKAYARNSLEHMILNTGYERLYKLKNSNISIYPVLELNFAKTGIKVENYWPPDFQSAITQVEVSNFVVQNNTRVLWITAHIGIGADIPITNRFDFTQHISLNPNYIIVKEDGISNNQTVTVKYSYRELFNHSYTLGLKYKL